MKRRRKDKLLPGLVCPALDGELQELVLKDASAVCAGEAALTQMGYEPSKPSLRQADKELTEYFVALLIHSVSSNSVEILECRAGCCTPANPTHGRLLQENFEFEDSLPKQ